MMPFPVSLLGPSPWGFRISGGRDFKKAITVSKVNSGSKADVGCLQPGDIIMEINGHVTHTMLNAEAQHKIKQCTSQLQLLIERPAPTPSQTNGLTEQLVGHFQEAVQIIPDENQNYRNYISSPTSLSPDPDQNQDSPTFFDIKSGRDSPINRSLEFHCLPSEEKNVHRLLPQEFASVDSCGNPLSTLPPVPGLNSEHIPVQPSCDLAMQRFDRDSEVYKMIQENKESRVAPRQSNTFKMLQEVLEADEKEATIRFPSKLSPSPPKPSQAGVHKYHKCEKCGTDIVTQAVKVTDDHFRHPECYTCTECGLNLKMRGHFWVQDEMFCEKHARERYQMSPHH